ncbi:MAG TPA: hypothetical protein VET25_10025, partial [Aestuariivirgaceae bacterium]|nr:hypothetical protein [Aestuariivirgaceae bacterium]
MGLAHGAGQEALDGKQTELAAALEEATRLLAETKRLHDEKVTAMVGECERLRTDFAKARADLVAVAEQSAKGRADSARNESEFKALIISLQAELHDKTSELQRERDQAGTVESLAVAQAENAGLRAQLS